jgi:hypothetical protein
LLRDVPSSLMDGAPRIAAPYENAG